MKPFQFRESERDTDRARRPSFLGRSFGRAKLALGAPEIAEGAGFITHLLRLVRSSPAGDRRLRVDGEGRVELEATAFLYGMTVEGLLREIAVRRRQTARSAYLSFGVGSIFLLLWLATALHLRMNSARLASAVEFMPFCLLFFLLAFKSAWRNWQLRTHHVGSALAYLTTSEPFLPRQ